MFQNDSYLSDGVLIRPLLQTNLASFQDSGNPIRRHPQWRISLPPTQGGTQVNDKMDLLPFPQIPESYIVNNGTTMCLYLFLDVDRFTTPSTRFA